MENALHPFRPVGAGDRTCDDPHGVGEYGHRNHQQRHNRTHPPAPVKQAHVSLAEKRQSQQRAQTAAGFRDVKRCVRQAQNISLAKH